MTGEVVPVFLNGTMYQLAAGTRLAPFLAAQAADVAAAWQAGRAQVTDGRGIALDPDTQLTAGAVIRAFVSARQAGDSPDA